jgi:Ni,Fe-hydrogenase III small subunit
MNLLELKILGSHGWQTIRSVEKVTLTPLFCGRPEIDSSITSEELLAAESICPTKAISAKKEQLNLGRCTFCRECEYTTSGKIRFTNDYKTATNNLDHLTIKKGESQPIRLNPYSVRSEVRRYFGRALKLRQVCAGGDGSTELELNAATNVNFDMGRFGIDFVASPRHADGLVITGPITRSMEEALEICYQAMPEPKLIILAGTDAISGGIFADSPATGRSFLERHKVDLYVPGNPVHPLTFINGILHLLGKNKVK